MSLFCGCGGLDVGFIKKGFKIVEAHDVDVAAVKTYNQNHPSVARATDLSLEPVSIPKCDILLAGPPCQGFSTIGSLRPNDKRNSLLIAACEMAVARRPNIIILENVTGLTTSRNKSLFVQAISTLSDGGYFVEPLTIKAENVGVAQKRRRVVIVARRGKRPFHIEIRTGRRHTVADAFRSIRSDPLATELLLGSKARLIAERIGQGQKLCNVRESPASVHTWHIPEAFGPTTDAEQALLHSLLRLRRTSRVRNFGDADPVSFERLDAENSARSDTRETIHSLQTKGYVKLVGDKFDLVHTFNGTFRRLRLDAPSPTVDTHFGNHRLFLHPEKHRGLSVREAAALQSFDPSFRWPESRQVAYRLIGNAVPPRISAFLASVASGLI